MKPIPIFILNIVTYQQYCQGILSSCLSEIKRQILLSGHDFLSLLYICAGLRWCNKWQHRLCTQGSFWVLAEAMADIVSHWLSPYTEWAPWIRTFMYRFPYCTIWNGYRIHNPLITSFMGPKWGLSVAGRTQVGPILAPWTLLSRLCITEEVPSQWEKSYFTIKYIVAIKSSVHSFRDRPVNEAKWVYMRLVWL